MHWDEEQRRIHYARNRPQRPGLLTKALGVAASVIVLIGAFALSLVLFALALAVLAAFGAYAWWKTRDLRRDLRRQMRAGSGDGNVIEGEVLRSEDVPERRPQDRHPPS